MFTNIASDIIKLVPLTSYKPQWVNKSTLLKNPQESPLDASNASASSETGNGAWNKRPVFRVHVGKNSISGTYYIRVWLWQMAADAYVDMPATSFKEGQVYEMYFDKFDVVDGSGNTASGQYTNIVLVGHRTTYMPIDHPLMS